MQQTTNISKKNKIKKGNWIADSFIWLFLLFVLLIAVFPLLYAFFGSFKSSMEFAVGGARLLPTQWQFVNYANAWEQANFARYTLNSIFVTAFSVLGTLVLSTMAGYVFARGQFPGKGFIMGLFLATMFLSAGTITIYPIFTIAKALKLQSSLWGLIMVYVMSINVTNVYLVMGYVKSISWEIDEAATIDGCGFFKIYWRIIMPLCMPIIATLALLTFKGIWNDYLIPLVFTMSKPHMRTLTIGVVALQSTSQGAAAYDLILAGTVISLLPIVVVFIFTNRYFISGVTMGAVKG